MWVSILISWLVACALGVFCTWVLRAKGAGFVMGFGLVAFYWLLFYLYPVASGLCPAIIS